MSILNDSVGTVAEFPLIPTFAGVAPLAPLAPFAAPLLSSTLGPPSIPIVPPALIPRGESDSILKFPLLFKSNVLSVSTFKLPSLFKSNVPPIAWTNILAAEVILKSTSAD